VATPASIETWDAAQDAEVRDILARVSDDRLAFLVVYGSMSRGDQRIDSDLDIYYETRDDAVELERTDPDSHAHVFGYTSSRLAPYMDRRRRAVGFSHRRPGARILPTCIAGWSTF